MTATVSHTPSWRAWKHSDRPALALDDTVLYGSLEQ